MEILQVLPQLTTLQRLFLVATPGAPRDEVQLVYWETLRLNLSLHLLDIGIPDSDIRKDEYRKRNKRLQQVAKVLRQRPVSPELMAAMVARLVKDGKPGLCACYQTIAAYAEST